MLGEIQQVVTIGATAAGVWIATNGLNTWKQELTGKRDIELCQKVIEKFYEAEEQYERMRSPISFANEAAGRAVSEEENAERKFQLDTAFTPVSRFNNSLEFWTSLLALKWQMEAAFGEEATKPFAEVDSMLREFRTAATMRYQYIQRHQDLGPALRLKFESTIWTDGEDDPKTARMKRAVADMEAICAPIVRASRRPRWRLPLSMSKTG